MARVNLDGKVWKDPRVKRLALRMKWSMRETVGTLAAVWDVACDLKSEHMTGLDIDTAAETSGFAAALAHPDIELADPGDGGTFRLHGITERIHYLMSQAERGRMGGAARLANAERTPDGRLASAKQTPSKRLASAKHIPDLPPDLDLPPAPALPPVLDLDLRKEEEVVAGATPSRSKNKKITAEEQASVAVILAKLGERSGINYRGSVKHTALIVARLRDGLTEWDLRRVIGYCAIKLGWQDKPEMSSYLRPETLFGPQSIEKYLDAARSWEPGNAPPAQEGTRPDSIAPRASGDLVDATSNVLPFPFDRNATNDYSDPAFEEPTWMTTTAT